ncbi:MAG: hypothetical protein ABWZ17_06370 [Candidatus Binatia bacterium]
MSEKITPKELAAELNCDAKTLRRVMRSMTDEQPGSGGRWEIERDSEFHLAIAERVSRTHNRKTVTATLKNSPQDDS